MVRKVNFSRTFIKNTTKSISLHGKKDNRKSLNNILSRTLISLPSHPPQSRKLDRKKKHVESTLRKIGCREQGQPSPTDDAWEPWTALVHHPKSLLHICYPVAGHHHCRHLFSHNQRRLHSQSRTHIHLFYHCVFYQCVFYPLCLWILFHLFVFSFFTNDCCLFCMMIVAFCSHYYHRQNDHVNYLLHGVFTLSMSFLIGLSCTFTNGMTLTISSQFFSTYDHSFIWAWKYLFTSYYVCSWILKLRWLA